MTRSRSRRVAVGRAVVGIVATALLVASCGATEPESEPEPEPARIPFLVDEALPVVNTAQMRLPASFEELQVVDPGWGSAAQYADDVFIAARERDGVLEFTAVDIYGDVLWSAQRPISCTGFTITSDSAGRALAILPDIETTDTALADTTASAYDMSTGDLVWGPVEVPGSHQGPGLIFAAPAPRGVMGATGPRTALDSSTGNVVATEADSGAERIFGEYHGTLLLTDADVLMARDTATGHELWRISLAEHGWTQDSLRPSVAAPPGEGLVLIETSAGSGALLDLADGTVLSETAREAAVDETSGVLVVLDAAGLHAYDGDNEPLWSLSVNPETTIAALGGVLLYLREEGAVRVHNVITGNVAQAYDPHGQGQILVPAHITAAGAALLLDGQHHLIAAADRRPGVTDQSP